MKGLYLLLMRLRVLKHRLSQTVIPLLELGLEVFPVLNKIDLPSANKDLVLEEIEEAIGIDSNEAVSVSARQGWDRRTS